jgi:hypothetical protein
MNAPVRYSIEKLSKDEKVNLLKELLEMLRMHYKLGIQIIHATTTTTTTTKRNIPDEEMVTIDDFFKCDNGFLARVLVPQEQIQEETINII